MTLTEAAAILEAITYKDWLFFLREHEGFRYLQVRFKETDPYTNEVVTAYGRKWHLSEHMTRSEVVQTALMAVLAAEEHEARERFRYKGRAIFGPHFSVEALVDMAGYKANLDLRPSGDFVDEWTS